ncbi:MAG TPA: hypothetical protein VGA99_02190 [bacterium]
MLLEKKVSVPDWLKENDLLSMLLSHAITKYEFFASHASMYSKKYGSDYESFKRTVEDGQAKEVFERWDDLIEWEAYETAAADWKARSEELKACLTL